VNPLAQSTLESQKTTGSPAALLAASVALLAFFFTSGQPWLVPVLLLGIWATALVPFRFAPASFAPFIARMLLFAFIGLSSMAKRGSGYDGLFEAKTLNTLGLIIASEMTIQFWRASPRSSFQGAVILCSGLIILIATNTTNVAHINPAVPVFFASVAWMLRDFTQLPVAQLRSKQANRKFHARKLAWSWMFALLALGVGFSAQQAVIHYRGELMSLGMNLMYNRPLPQVAGISSQPRLSSRFQSPDSPQRVLRVEGELRDPHLRAAAFDTYAGRTWSPALTDAERKPQALPETPLSAEKGITTARITRLVDPENKVLFAPLNSRAIVGTPGSTIEYDATFGGPLRSEELAPYEYTVQESDQEIEGVSTHQGPLCAPLDETTRQRCLQLPPEIDPKVRELANEITKDAFLPAEKALAINDYLLSNFQYSLEIRLQDREPVSDFLLNKKAAHCEFFAAGAAILLRSVGIPSRYVVGYLAHEESAPGVITVRQRDAHAWTECFIDGVGWVTMDATPGSGRPDQLPPVSWWQRTWEKLQDASVRLREKMTLLSREQWGMVLVAILLLWGVSRWRLARRQSTLIEENELYFVPDVRLKQAVTRFENWLQRHEIEIPEATSWTKYFEESMQLVEFPRREHAEQFVREYERVRWGHSHDAQAVEHVVQLIEKLEQPVAQRK
jgi:transglutaminase-like putative cysteine protease